ncbi:hypothetical protein I2501_06435 [Streptacidiphilus sp. NEAU-YB345]|uniref:Uncharacterized protein n=1 Tax=Streptacidiphilus fuscans TaxID=2789292 RepID=A0A931AZP7_9ACTN|nr:hypothetical protein [Streptacidiphilus fuscans]
MDELDRAVDATRQALAQLRACLPSPCPSRPTLGPVEVSDTPYDPAMWWDAEDEGIGGHRR